MFRWMTGFRLPWPLVVGLLASAAIHAGIALTVPLPSRVVSDMPVLAAEVIELEPDRPLPPPVLHLPERPRPKPRPLPQPMTPPRLVERTDLLPSPPEPKIEAPAAPAPPVVESPPPAEPAPTRLATPELPPPPPVEAPDRERGRSGESPRGSPLAGETPALPQGGEGPSPAVGAAAGTGVAARSGAGSSGDAAPRATGTRGTGSGALVGPRGGYQVKPGYPANVRRLGVQGTTMLRVHVLADGHVGDVEVEASAGHPDLDRAAVDAVRQWRFDPARRGTEAVAMWVLLPVEFRLR